MSPGAPPLLDTSAPSGARVYDCLLGGKDNFAVDRELAARLLDPAEGYPGLRGMAAVNRVFITKAVAWLARNTSIGQYLDLGSGLPAGGLEVTLPGRESDPMVLRDVHETARALIPDARVVYADIDAVAVLHCEALLAGAGVAAVQGDLRYPDAILRDARQVLDLTQPCAVILGAVLHFFPAGQAGELVARYASRLVPGSAVVISAGRYEEGLHARLAALSPAPWFNHSPGEIQGWFGGAGLELVRPKVANVTSWPMMPAAVRSDGYVVGGVGLKG